jgi:hypothetical protein
MSALVLRLLPLLALGAFPALAFKAEGRLDIGMRADPREDASAYYEAEVDIETERVEGARAAVEIGADADSREVEVNEALIDIKYGESPWRLKFGLGKKILGWEYEDGATKRLSTRRSLIYRYLEPISLVGREYLVSLAYDNLRASLHYNAFGTESLALAHEFALSEESVWGHWLTLGNNGGHAVVSGFKSKAEDGTRWGAELFLGQDPAATQFEKSYVDGDRVLFAGARVEYGLGLGAWMPYLLLSHLLRDLRESGTDEQQALLGLRWTSETRLALTLEFDFTGVDSMDGRERSWEQSSARFEARYVF